MKMDPRERVFREAAEIERKMREEEEREREENPLSAFSTTQLKAELRRRKRR